MTMYDENAMKSCEEVIKKNLDILEQLCKETKEWLEELKERNL